MRRLKETWWWNNDDNKIVNPGTSQEKKTQIASTSQKPKEKPGNLFIMSNEMWRQLDFQILVSKTIKNVKCLRLQREQSKLIETLLIIKA